MQIENYFNDVETTCVKMVNWFLQEENQSEFYLVA